MRTQLAIVALLAVALFAAAGAAGPLHSGCFTEYKRPEGKPAWSPHKWSTRCLGVWS